MLLVVLVTALQLAAPRAGSPVPGVLPGAVGEAVGAAAALIGGVVLWWRRSRPVSVLAVCVPAYAVNAVVVPGVPPYTGWLALYAAGAFGRQAARAWYAAAAGAAALVAVFAACTLIYPKTVSELVLLIAVTAIAALAGTLVRSRRAQLAALRDRAEALERERVSAEARAAAEERLRIARDVHDASRYPRRGPRLPPLHHRTARRRLRDRLRPLRWHAQQDQLPGMTAPDG